MHLGVRASVNPSALSWRRSSRGLLLHLAFENAITSIDTSCRIRSPRTSTRQRPQVPPPPQLPGLNILKARSRIASSSREFTPSTSRDRPSQLDGRAGGRSNADDVGGSIPLRIAVRHLATQPALREALPAITSVPSRIQVPRASRPCARLCVAPALGPRTTRPIRGVGQIAGGDGNPLPLRRASPMFSTTSGTSPFGPHGAVRGSGQGLHTRGRAQPRACSPIDRLRREASFTSRRHARGRLYRSGFD